MSIFFQLIHPRKRRLGGDDGSTAGNLLPKEQDTAHITNVRERERASRINFNSQNKFLSTRKLFINTYN